jgi:hypothetical protein
MVADALRRGTLLTVSATSGSESRGYVCDRDGSEDAELALITAVGLARIADSELPVVTVLPESAYVGAYYTAGRLQRIQASQQAARKVLEEQLYRSALLMA